LIVSGLGLALAGCGSMDGPKTDAQLQDDIVSNMHALVVQEMQGLNQAARDLQAAAPSTLAGGWDASLQAVAALATMREAWQRSRLYWERVEGTVAPIFPDLDGSMDARYEDYLDAAGGVADADPFDGEGITGMHAVERVLFIPGPPSVVAFEMALSGYELAAWPASDQEAADFKGGLCQRLVDDSQSLLDQWRTRAIDLDVVFTGLTGLIAAQAEKMSLAAAHQEESRYSDTTLADLRSNLMGTRAIYKLFTPWLESKALGTTLDNNAIESFDRLDKIYADIPSNAIPTPPPTWSSSQPSQDDLLSPFGLLYTAVVQEVDPTSPGSAVDAMNHVARTLGLHEFPGN
jgi:iron uptake system component EfeO